MNDETTIWERCTGCRGSGQQVGLFDVEECRDCQGSGRMRARDADGRFRLSPVEAPEWTL